MHDVTQILLRLFITLALAIFVFIFPNVLNVMNLIGSIFFPVLGKFNTLSFYFIHYA